MKRTLTLMELEKMGACSEARRAFKKRFGAKADLEKVLLALHKTRESDWEGWLLGQEPGLTKALLARGADIHAGNDGALQWASNNGHKEVVRILLAHGADIHAGNDATLRWAAIQGHERIVKILKAAMAEKK